MTDRPDASAMRPYTTDLARYAADCTFEDIPDEVVERARLIMIDTVGAMIFGARLPWSGIVADYAEAMGSRGHSRILRPGGPMLHAAAAALTNGVYAHAFELDGAVKPGAGTHPGATIFPAVLAIAQQQASSGKDVIAAFVAASEVMIRIGRATKKTNEHRGFHAPGTTGPFGATVGAGKLLHLDAGQMANAMGIAGSFASGLIQYARSRTAGMIKRLHFGRVGEGGVTAASLAAAGFTAPDDILEGEFGFLRVFCEDWDMDALTRDLGKDYLLLTSYTKRFACHGNAQAIVTAIQALQAGHGFKGGDVAAIAIRGSAEMVDRHNITEPGDLMAAQYSIPFSAALACFRNPRDPRSFDLTALGDDAIRSLCRRTTLDLIDDAQNRKRDACRVSIRLQDGRVLEMFNDDFKGTPTIPSDRMDTLEKFLLLTRDCGDARSNELFDRLGSLERETDLHWLSV